MQSTNILSFMLLCTTACMTEPPPKMQRPSTVSETPADAEVERRPGPEGGITDAGRDTETDAGERDDGGMRPDVGMDTETPDFVEELIDGSGIHGQGATLVDFEGDGDLDVVTAFSLTDGVRIYLNDGDGESWTPIEAVPEGTVVAMHATAVDIDGDGDRDLAVVGLFDRSIGFSSAGEVTWFENPGNVDARWIRHEITGLTFWAPLSIRAGDLTGDSRPDLVVGSIEIGGDGNGLFWFRNTGAGFSEPIPIESTLGYVSSSLLHDVDADGDLDVLASSYSGGELIWYENERDGASERLTFARHTMAALPGPNSMVLAQMDSDAELEVVSTSANGSGGQIAWYDPPADPSGAWSENVIVSDRGEGETRIGAGDLNGDGRTDVALTSLERSEVVLLLDDGAGGYEATQIAGDYVGANWLEVGDIDNDGLADFVTTTYDFPGGDRIAWWRSR